MATRPPSSTNVVALFMCVTVLASANDVAGQNHIWSRSFGSTGKDESQSICVDADGNVILTGHFEQPVNFGGGVFTPVGYRDMVLAKYGPSGSHTWSRQFGNEYDTRGASVCVDGTGSIYVTGYFYETVDLGGGALTSLGGNDIFLAKYDADGNHIWSKRFGGEWYEESYSVHSDALGGVSITGIFMQDVDFGGGTITGDGNQEAFIATYDGDGNHIWSRRSGDYDSSAGREVRVVASGDVLLVGSLQPNTEYPSWENPDRLTFLEKYDGGGNRMWYRESVGNGRAHAFGVEIDAAGGIYVTGFMDSTVDLGGGPLTSHGSSDVFLAKYDSSGGHLWSRAFGGSRGEWGLSVAVDQFGEVYTTGFFFSEIAHFGGAPLVGHGKADMFLAKYSTNGTHLWSAPFGDGLDDTGQCVRVDAQGDAIVVGNFSGAMSLGGDTLSCVGEWDIFLAKFGDTSVPVAISSFEAQPIQGGVALRASFVSELGGSGVDVYRSAESAGHLVLQDHVALTSERFYYEDSDIVPGNTYRYQIGVSDEDGVVMSRVVSVTVPGHATALLPNVPNPFNPETTVRFMLELPAHVSLEIYDTRGRWVRTLVDGDRVPGLHEVRWDGTNGSGSTVASGVYFYRMRAGDQTFSRRMVLLK